MSENRIKAAFIAAFNSVIGSKEPYLAACREAKKQAMDTTALEAEIKELESEMAVSSELMSKWAEANAISPQDQEGFNARYNAYVEHCDGLKAKRDALAAERDARKSKAKAIDRFIRTVEKREGLLAEFDPYLWLATVQSVTVGRDGGLTFRFFDGTEVIK